MKKIVKILCVCFLCIGIVKGNERTVFATEGDVFSAKISVGGKAVDAKFKVLSEGNGEAKGTVQIGTGVADDIAIDQKTTGDMILPETIENEGKAYTVTEIGDDAFKDCESLTSTGLAGNSTITTIGAYAFFGCVGLTSTGLESNTTATSIGNAGFAKCKSLTSTGLASNSTINSIGISSFLECQSLTSTGLESNSTITVISDTTFAFCTALTSSGLESNGTIISIGDNAFEGSKSLVNTGLSANSKVASIGNNAFINCNKLTSFIFKNNNIPVLGTNVFPITTNTYYFEEAINTERLDTYNSTEIKVNSIKLLDKTYHEGDAFTPKGSKFQVGYSKTNGNEEVVSDIVDYDRNISEFMLKDTILKKGNNVIDAEYLGKKLSLNIVGEAHTFELKNDEINHWNECSKEKAINDKEAHTYGEWIIDLEPTTSIEGKKHTECSKCGNLKIERIEVLSSPNDKVVKVVNTGDQTNVGAYVGMMMLALGACIWLRKIRD